MENIELRDIPGFEGKYAASSDGRIYSYRSKNFLSPFNNGHGYQVINLGGRNWRVHILVALAFGLEKPEGATVVGHLDDDRQNNRPENLKWITQKENLDTDHFREACQHKQRTKVRCVETGEVFKNQTAAAAAIGKHRYGINNCLMGKQLTCGGYHWERVLEDG